MQIGIVGLPYSGKTTLFQTLTETHQDTEALAKRHTNQAVVKVPDERLDRLTEIFKPKKQVNASIDIIDMAGVQRGETAGSAFTSNYISKIRTNDAIIHVVRCFEDETVPHIEGSIDMVRDVKLFEEEFIFSDMAFLENRFERLEKDMRNPKSRDRAAKELEYMKKWNDTLQQETPLRELDYDQNEKYYVKNYQPLTAKPLIIALNLSEKDVKNSSELVEKVNTEISGKNVTVEPFFAKIEMELSQLEDKEKQIFMQEYGLKESPLNRMIRSAYDLLGLQSFFTVGDDECRAWTINKGMNAQEAAGEIHTDFYNKFIRAEVVNYDQFIEQGSMAKCRDAGLLRLEGKDYIVQDGDIINVRHG